MIKKWAPFLCCLTPIYAFAEDTIIPGTPGQMSQIDGALSLGAGSYIFQSGAGINVGGGITTAGGVYVGYDAVAPLVGGSIYAESGIDTNYSIITNGSVSIGGVLDVAVTKNLTIGGSGGALYNFVANAIEVGGGLNLYGNIVSAGQFVASGSGTATIEANSLSITNNGTFQALGSKNVTVNVGTGMFNVSGGGIENKASGTMSLTAGQIIAKNITNESNYGTLNINATSLQLSGGDSTTNASFINKGNFTGVVSGATTLAHGFDLSSMGAANTFSLTTGTLVLNDRIDAFYDNNLASFTVNVTGGIISANTIRNGYDNLSAIMNLSASGGINAIGVVANGGTMSLSAPNISVGAGGISVADTGILNISNATTITSAGAVSVAGNLTAGATGAAQGEFGVGTGWTDISTGTNGFNVGGVSANGSGNGVGIYAQTVNVANNVLSNNAGGVAFNTNTLNVGGNIGGDDVAINNMNSATGMNITVGGNILGGTDIIGLGHMTVGGDYLFDDNSRLVAFANSGTGFSYWGTATFDSANNVSVITNNVVGAEPLISVSGQLITNISGGVASPDNSPLLDSQIGINLRSVVNGNSAIWLVHADSGIQELATRISGLSINFCNATGTICMDYLAATGGGYNGAGTDLPIHLVSYDTDGDGESDSLYVVFDDVLVPNGGLLKLQPIVASAPYYTTGEYQSAGALDNLIEYELLTKGFSYESPMGVARILFDDTVLHRVSEELYQRMNYYWLHDDPNVIRAFSRVFQLREANQIADMLELNTHTVFKDLSDRFIDESIWNRNRRVNKAWFVADYGYFVDDMVDNHAHGSRIGFNFGYDWQLNKTLILGWTGHVAHTRGLDGDVIDLGYGTVAAAGHVNTDVRNLNVGGGMYFIQTLNNKLRWYGDAMLDLNFIDITRDQTWVDTINGDAVSYGLVGETGLIHDWLNQYIVGNLYLRTGYNFGFDMTEKVGGVNYMNLDFDGHFILTPGYSLTAQKRIYPSARFQFRPYAMLGVEYDLISAPDTMKYKFAAVNPWTEYDVGVDPLWVHAGAGVEFLSVNGLHVGVGYRYQYNANVQMHKIHLSGMYRF